MSFLSGIFLFALPLAAVPVVLHFYRRHRKDVVAWGAMQFLVDAAREGRRRERLEEILLMILRCAAVLALVLALARPQVHSQWLGNAPRREVILVIDNSLSMSRVTDDQPVFSDLQEQARDLCQSLSHTDIVQILLAVGGPDWLMSEGIAADPQGQTSLLQKIDQLKPSQGSADLFSSVQAAVDAGMAEEIHARQIIVFTDLQAHGWQTNAAQHWRDLGQSIDSREVPVTVQVIPCGLTTERINNLSIAGVEASRTQAGPGQSIRIDCQIQNLGHISSGPQVLEQLVDGEVIGTSDVEALAGGASTSASWTWIPEQAGVYAVSCRVRAEDQLPPDDDRAVIVEVVDRIPVLIVEGTSEYRQRISSAELLAAALGYDRETPHAGWHSVFAPTIIPSRELQEHSLADYQAVIITSLTPQLSDAAERLRQFVDQGGGLWIVLTRRTDREAFNAVWYDDGDGLSPLPLAGLISHHDDTDAEELIHPPGTDHPATAHIADTNRLDIDRVRITARMQFDQQVYDEQLSVLLENGSGAPLAIERYVGRGRVIVQGLPFGIGWSNLALTRAWVVMVHDWLSYLTQPAATQFNLTAGSRIELPRSFAGEQRDAVIATPDGWTRELTLQDTDEVGRYRFSQTQYPGRYTVAFGAAPDTVHTVPFEVSRDAQESDLTALTNEEQQQLTETSGIEFSESAAAPLAAPVSGTFQRPVWNALLTGLLILLAVELLLATLTARWRTPETTLSMFDEPGTSTLPEYTTSS